MRRFSIAASLLVSLLSAGLAHGDLIQYSDRDAFNAQGTILFNYGFEDTGTPDAEGICYPGTPWTSNGVTYSTDLNAVMTPSSTYEPLSNVFVNIYGTITGSLSTTAACQMLAMDVAAIANTGYTDALIKTNLKPSGYKVGLSSLPDVSAAQKFYGFKTDSMGEYFTGFVVYYSAVQPAIDNVTLGVVPEPSVLALLGTGLLGIAGFVARRQYGSKRG